MLYAIVIAIANTIAIANAIAIAIDVTTAYADNKVSRSEVQRQSKARQIKVGRILTAYHTLLHNSITL